MNSRDCIKTILAGAALAAVACLPHGAAGEAPAAQPAGAAPPRPNIVVIFVDDMGYAEVGAFGCRDIPTPNIDALARETVEFIERNKQRPFFLYLPTTAVHGGVEATPKYIDRFDPKHPRRIYAACLSAVDDAVGVIVAKLRAEKLDRNTLILFASDNGGTSEKQNHPLRGAKQTPYEGGSRHRRSRHARVLAAAAGRLDDGRRRRVGLEPLSHGRPDGVTRRLRAW